MWLATSGLSHRWPVSASSNAIDYDMHARMRQQLVSSDTTRFVSHHGTLSGHLPEQD